MTDIVKIAPLTLSRYNVFYERGAVVFPPFEPEGCAVHDNNKHVLIRELAPSHERLPLFVIGDVHGCAWELKQLLEKAQKKISRFQVLLVGDLFTKGPDPVGVYEIINEYKAFCIKGNHDWALWSAILSEQKKSGRILSEHTQQTLHLIRYHKRAIFELLLNLPHGFVTRVVPSISRPQWESSYPVTIVHAGIDCHAGLKKTSERMLLTVRYVRWGRDEAGNQKLVLVPANARQGGQTTLSGAPAEPRLRWHEFHHGPELIIFGHDAKQGLFRKTLPTGRPICVGLDTGCTYGRALTGYFLERDEAIQVEARRIYFDLSKNIILLRR